VEGKSAAPKILVVDDERSILEFVSYNLTKEGHDITTAMDGDTAVLLAEQCSFDLVILDVMLPGIDGYAVCKKIRKHSAVPLLFLSARDTELDKVVGLELGATITWPNPSGFRSFSHVFAPCCGARPKALKMMRYRRAYWKRLGSLSTSGLTPRSSARHPSISLLENSSC